MQAFLLVAFIHHFLGHCWGNVGSGKRGKPVFNAFLIEDTNSAEERNLRWFLLGKQASHGESNKEYDYEDKKVGAVSHALHIGMHDAGYPYLLPFALL